MPSLVEQTVYTDIIEAAEFSYAALVEQDSYYTRENVYRRPVCHVVGGILVSRLASMGYPAVQEIRAVGAGEHSYGVIDHEAGEIIADPTWQQFVSYNPRAKLPHVLIGTRDQVVDHALEFGVHASHTRYWRPSPLRVVRQPLPHPVLT